MCCNGLTGWHLYCRIISLVFFSRMEGYALALIIPFGPLCCRIISLAFFSKMEGYAWVFVIPFGLIVVYLCFWRKLSSGCVRAHPSGVAPDALEG
jgi:hypothetical protein